jgi:Pentapeptide repeats (8 copies)
LSIAQESEREYWPIMETLTAYVREHAPWPPQQSLGNPRPRWRPSADEVAGSRQIDSESASAKEPNGTVEQRPQPATDIQAILNVLGRRDETARKGETTERRLDLTVTDLRGAFLRDVHLEGADLRFAHLEGAHLGKAHLEHAYLVGTYLEGAVLWGAHLEGALLEADGLTQDQLIWTFGDDRTSLPNGLKRPAHWSAPTADEPYNTK